MSHLGRVKVCNINLYLIDGTFGVPSMPAVKYYSNTDTEIHIDHLERRERERESYID